MTTIIIILLLIASVSLADNVYRRFRIDKPDQNISNFFRNSFFPIYFRFRYLLPINKNGVNNADLKSAKRANISLYIFLGSFILLLIIGLLNKSAN